jgi:hypothetical protein
MIDPSTTRASLRKAKAPRSGADASGTQVVAWKSRHYPPVYTITIAGTPTAGSVEKMAGGRFHACDDRGRSLGTFQGLRATVEQVVREEQR